MCQPTGATQPDDFFDGWGTGFEPECRHQNGALPLAIALNTVACEPQTRRNMASTRIRTRNAGIKTGAYRLAIPIRK